MPLGSSNIGGSGYEVIIERVTQKFSVVSVCSVANKLLRGFK
jgi:hypothetical protein